MDKVIRQEINFSHIIKMINQIILNELNWIPNRKVDVLFLKEYLTQNGYFWSEKVNSFLEEFAWLKTKELHFDAVKAEKDIDPLWIQNEYAGRLNKTDLCIIGQAHNSHLTLFMDSHGKVYGGYDDFLCFIGYSYESAIENIYFNKDIIQL